MEQENEVAKDIILRSLTGEGTSEKLKRFLHLVDYSREIKCMEYYAERVRWNYPPCYPPLIEGQNYSENVLAEVEGFIDLQVMCYIYVEGEDGGFMWATCNKTLDGDAELDDNYTVIKWQYIPKI